MSAKLLKKYRVEIEKLNSFLKIYCSEVEQENEENTILLLVILDFFISLPPHFGI